MADRGPEAEDVAVVAEASVAAAIFVKPSAVDTGDDPLDGLARAISNEDGLSWRVSWGYLAQRIRARVPRGDGLASYSIGCHWGRIKYLR